MKNTKRWNLLSLLCLLLSVMLVATSCVVVGPENPDSTGEQTQSGNGEGTTAANGGENTPTDDPNKLQFTITLKDDENYGWEGVRVQICEKGDSGKCSMPQTTDANGVAVITVDKTLLDINNSAVKIVKADGYVTTTEHFEIILGETSKTIKLAEYVVKADNFGSGVENVAATVSVGETAVATGNTNGEGEVKFLLATDDDYVVTVVSPEGASPIDSTQTSWAFGEGFNVTISYLVIVLVDKTVTVVDENAQPVADATVLLVSTSNEKDENGNYIGAYTGTTDATGKVTFAGLNSTSRYFVVVNGIAVAGQDDEKAWLDMGVNELTVTYSTAAAANVKYTVKVGYNNTENVFVVLEGTYTVIVVTYNDDLEAVEVARYTTVNGVVEFELPENVYAVMIDETSVPEGYESTGAAGFFDNIAELTLTEKVEAAPGASSENPLSWVTQHPMTGMPVETTQTLTGLAMGQQVWYQLTWSVGMELYVETTTMGAVICVEYNGRTLYTTDGKLTLVFEEMSPRQQQALIGIYLGGRMSPADVTLTVREAGSGGSDVNNNPDNLPGSGTDAAPFILSEGGTYTAVVTVSNAFMTPTVYEITILSNGTLTVSGLGNNHWIRMECIAKSISTDSTDPTENINSISHAVNAGEVWRIIVGTWDEQAGEVPFTVTLS